MKSKKYKTKVLKYLLRLLICLIGVLIIAISFNVFYVPNNFVTGGVSGLAIIFNKITSLDSSIFILIGNIFFVILSIAFLGIKRSINNIIGAIAFSLFVFLTKDINAILNIQFNNVLLDVLCAGVTTGIGSGIVYKVNFSSGGTDILIDILNQKLKISKGKAIIWVSIIILGFGTFVFGLEMLVYALIIKYIESILVDKILLGISDSKMFFIKTQKEKEVIDYIFKNVESGVTLLKGTGGYTKQEGDMIMCIVPTEKYYRLKEKIKEIDEHVFLIVSDCYEVQGGTKRKKVSLTRTIN